MWCAWNGFDVAVHGHAKMGRDGYERWLCMVKMWGGMVVLKRSDTHGGMKDGYEGGCKDMWV